ncbi:hypothetical protein EYF80_042545 [Liparis tanakae]|uniref:Uncharacterized protein n=1 Tax=Liparis tanakae TaxID=230148 RepID=A0A4Z2G185_9TELE|nr:hypothetical protein EYF80_042545 [Liparis tanakae]
MPLGTHLCPCGGGVPGKRKPPRQPGTSQMNDSAIKLTPRDELHVCRSSPHETGTRVVVRRRAAETRRPE